MKQEKIDLFYSAMLRDLIDLTERVPHGLEKDTLESVSGFNLNQFQFQEDFEDLVTVASRIASGLGDVPERDGLAKNQADIFNVFKEDYTNRYFTPKVLSLKGAPHFADKDKKQWEEAETANLLSLLEERLAELSFDDSSMESLLALYEEFLSFVPLSTRHKALNDISISEHSRLTVAFAFALYDYAQASGIEQSSLIGADHVFGEKAFLLASFDLSGIQDFIYNIASKGAAKQLKARSLYLDFMSEYIADSLLDHLDLPRTNLLYVGGGHAYFILPNTEQTIEVLEKYEKTYNRFLLEHFQTRLYVAFGWETFAAKDTMSDLGTLQSYRNVYRGVSRMISDKKISRYDAATLLTLNQGGKASQKECQLCHAVDHLTYYHDQDICQICLKLYAFSKQISLQYYLVSEEDGLPIGPNAYLKGVSETDIETLENYEHLYLKNEFGSGRHKATPIFVGDYKKGDIDKYADLSQGIKRLAVVRMDVDDLGAAFMAGFADQENGAYSTLSRSAMFSKSMSLFFKVYINHIADERKMSIIYAGGDDVFAIGAWQDIIAFTVDLRQQFRIWTNQKLSLSAGIGLFPDKSPISLMASVTGDLEEAAKDNGKDSISLFAEDYTFTFDTFIDKIYQGKLKKIRRYFNQQNEQGKSFIYKLIELLQNYTKMNTARLAYYLTRIEETTDKDHREDFKVFKDIFFKWYTGGEDERKEAELALLLYVYEIRKD